MNEYRTALQTCESDLIKRSKERRYQGMERVYRDTLIEVLKENQNFSEVRREVPLENIGGEALAGVGAGYVDIVVKDNNSNVHGIELKIVQLPRERHLAPMQCLFDIGQITWDFLRLKGAKKLTSFDCVIVLHGGFLSVRRTRHTLLREFHNRMFVDFKTSLTAGELKVQKDDPVRKKQVQLIKQLGLDQPFTEKTDSMLARTGKRLGLIRIHGPLS